MHRQLALSLVNNEEAAETVESHKQPSRLRRIGAGAVHYAKESLKSKFTRRAAAVWISIFVLGPPAGYLIGKAAVSGGSKQFKEEAVALREVANTQLQILAEKGGTEAIATLKANLEEEMSPDLARTVVCGQKLPKAYKSAIREQFKCDQLETDSETNTDKAAADIGEH